MRQSMIIKQLLEHNSMFLHAQPLETLISYDTLKNCLSEFVDYSEYPSVRDNNLQTDFKMMVPLLELLLPYCDQFVQHPGTCYAYEKGNFYVNVQWVKQTVETVGWQFIESTHSQNKSRCLHIPFTGDYAHVRLNGGMFVFNFPHRSMSRSSDLMNICAMFQIFISDCLEGEKLYGWFHYFICFLLFCLLNVIVSGDVRHVVSWCNPRFSHRYSPLVFYSLRETQLSGLRGVVECSKGLLAWWSLSQSFYEDIVNMWCKEHKTTHTSL